MTGMSQILITFRFNQLLTNDFTNERLFFLHETTQSFSVFTNKTCTFGILSKHFRQIRKFSLLDATCESPQWFHYTAVSKNNRVQIFTANGDLVLNIRTGFEPYFFRSFDSDLRIHNYSFLYSSKISNDYLISTQDVKCISMFVSVDNGCYLEFSDLSFTRVDGFNSPNSLKKWQRVELGLGVSKNASLILKKGCDDNRKIGFWAVDNIQNCGEKIRILRAIIPKDCVNCTCKELDHNKENGREHHEDKEENLNRSTTKCGSKCSICHPQKGCLNQWRVTAATSTPGKDLTSYVTNAIEVLQPELLFSHVTKELIVTCRFTQNVPTNTNISITVLENSSGQITEETFLNTQSNGLSYPISVDYNQEYTVEVSSKGEFQNIIFFIKVLPSSEEFSAKPFVEMCSKTCLLMIPIPKHLENIVFFVSRRNAFDEKTLKRNLLKPNGTLKMYNNMWIIKHKTVRGNTFQLEIGNGENVAVSVKNQTYVNCVFLNNLTIHPITFQEVVKDDKDKRDSAFPVSLSSLIIAGVLLLLLTIIIISILCIKRRKGNKNTNANYISLQRIVVNDKTLEKDDFVNILKLKIKSKNLEEEFQILSEKINNKKSWEAVREKNVKKNKTIDKGLPYDYNRVVLTEMIGVGTDDYINASYINGYDRPKSYIAAQGPKFNTIKDFWRMIWQERIKTIVMVANFVEKGKRMCAEYWPPKEGTTFECGLMHVDLVTEEKYEYYHKRKFEVHYYESTRSIQHFQLKWNSDDFLYPNSFIPVVTELRRIRQSNSYPVLIHSGLGTDRTGTLILCDLALEMLEKRNNVNFFILTNGLRIQRRNIISTPQHYVLAHLIVSEYLLQKDCPVKSDGQSVMFTKQQLHEQLKYIKRLCKQDKTIRLWKKNTKNVTQIRVDGYAKPLKYIVIPRRTKNDFWSLVTDHVINDSEANDESIHCIVMLNKCKRGFKLWPCVIEWNKSVVKVNCSNTTTTSHYFLSEISLELCHEYSTDNAQYSKNIMFYEIHEDHKMAPDHILNIITDVEKFKQIVVSCNDGISMSGLFVAVSHIVETFQMEQRIDVCNAIRTVRRSGVNFINSSQELELVYQCATSYLQNLKIYTEIN
ncbi:receptor-type tyrosine-protein phosphatase alpha isoform X3 [Tribolium castaneum]|uniref:receptor-type tyrosine-protein phosphatase alpha isoform X3 n=1 Tax=Tribolium castaneum TaxID=7070 RepID=UPI0030FEA832